MSKKGESGLLATILHREIEIVGLKKGAGGSLCPWRLSFNVKCQQAVPRFQVSQGTGMPCPQGSWTPCRDATPLDLINCIIHRYKHRHSGVHYRRQNNNMV